MNLKGRPKKGERKCYGYRLRMTEEEYQMLRFVSSKLGIDMASALRKGLRMVYNLAKIAA